MREQSFLYYLVKMKPKWWNTVFISKKNEWIVFPWENPLNLEIDRKEYIQKRGLN
ncbi:MAG: hypothetical protein CM15mP15_1130 [Prochlorococcus sp.]|nr:MAG: hypothetical protein CM15mP15_1130 [Prochlorococcus sp.]